MGESNFWKKLSKKLQLDFMGRVENSAGIGWPDVHYMNECRPGWIELKSENAFPNKIKFRPGQAMWMQNYSDRGGKGSVFLFLEVKSENAIYIWPGEVAQKLDQMGTKAVPAFMRCDMSGESWPKSVKKLLSLPNVTPPQSP